MVFNFHAQEVRPAARSRGQAVALPARTPSTRGDAWRNAMSLLSQAREALEAYRKWVSQLPLSPPLAGSVLRGLRVHHQVSASTSTSCHTSTGTCHTNTNTSTRGTLFVRRD